ncbi:MAG: glycosyltransferase family 2 protein [Bacteroidota bacterium]|nr:glycosyltransferase family 2 protein [Bacteroidota bacterium]
MLISAVIIAKNEEQNLVNSLAKLTWCNEIIVIDDFSSDQTAKVAESFGAIVIQNTFVTFGKQKQFAVNQAKNDWVLSIDADEILTDELIFEISKLDINNHKFEAYEIPRTHVFLGKTFKYGKESKDYIIRLFNRKNGHFDDAQVHERIIINGKTTKLNHKILHYSYKNLDHYFSKFNIYTTQGALKLKEKGKTRALLFCFIYFPFYFIKHYFIYLNIFNGWQGLVWSYLSAWYHTVKYLKLYEINKFQF